MIPLNCQTNSWDGKKTAVLQRGKDLNLKYFDIDEPWMGGISNVFLSRHHIIEIIRFSEDSMWIRMTSNVNRYPEKSMKIYECNAYYACRHNWQVRSDLQNVKYFTRRKHLNRLLPKFKLPNFSTFSHFLHGYIRGLHDILQLCPLPPHYPPFTYSFSLTPLSS